MWRGLPCGALLSFWWAGAPCYVAAYVAAVAIGRTPTARRAIGAGVAAMAWFDWCPSWLRTRPMALGCSLYILTGVTAFALGAEVPAWR